MPSFKQHPEVQLAHLVRHCSGLRYGSWHLRKRLGLEKTDTIQYENILEWVANEYETPYFLPGTESNYNNVTYMVLAAIVEKVSGQSFPDFLQQRIFTPLEMTTAVFRPNVLLSDAAGYAIPHIIKNKKQKPYTFGKGHLDYLHPGEHYGSYGLYISLADLTKISKLWGSNLILSEKNIQRLTGGDSFPNGKPNYYRYGYIATKTPHLESWNLRMSGNILGFISFVIYYPEYDLCIAMSTNQYPMVDRTYADFSLIDFYAEIKPILYDAFDITVPTEN